MLKIINVAGARPNFMKVAPIVTAMNRRASVVTPSQRAKLSKQLWVLRRLPHRLRQ